MVILGMIMSILDTTIVNVALRTLGHDLHSSISQIQWVVTGYLLVAGGGDPGDRLGGAALRRQARLHDLAGAVHGRLGAVRGWPTSTTSLVLFRVLQGVGGGMIMPVGQMIMAQVAGPQADGPGDGDRRDAGDARADPRPGGRRRDPAEPALVVDLLRQRPDRRRSRSSLGWRMLPHTESGEAGRLDVVGLALLSTASPAIVYGPQRARPSASFTAPGVRLADRRGVVLTVVFCWHALRVERPLLDVRLYANRVFAAASFTTFGLGAALFGAMILVPLYYQEVRGESVIVTGPAGRPAGARDADRDAVRRPPDRPLRRRARGARRRLDPVPQHDPARVRRRRHLDPLDLARAAAARRRHRPLASCRR